MCFKYFLLSGASHFREVASGSLQTRVKLLHQLCMGHVLKGLFETRSGVSNLLPARAILRNSATAVGCKSLSPGATSCLCLPLWLIPILSTARKIADASGQQAPQQRKALQRAWVAWHSSVPDQTFAGWIGSLWELDPICGL